MKLTAYTKPLARVLGAAVAAGAVVTAAAQESPTPVNYVEHIRPLLQENCTGCHGAERQQAGLRLDHRQPALRGSDEGPVIVPGKSGKSKLIDLVRGTEPGKRMPPDGPPLTQDQVALLTAWIDQGAEWPEDVDGPLRVISRHWAFQPVRRPAVPEVQRADWPRNAIDNFVLATLEAEGIAPAPEADRDTLIRRLYLDLVGLPPAPEDVDAFIADDSPHAYTALVNRVLASPHFGERWGRHWLDLARYADSDGYEKDGVRPHAYRYRDYVIDALNRDLPYDQFIIEQLAGDLLPNPSMNQLIATGFHRNTLTNTEGGIDPEEDRVKQAVDRTNTTASTFMALTMACAECHTHKYDPITHREYFGMYSFFNQADEKNIPAATQGEWMAYQKDKARYDAERARAVKEINDYKPSLKEAALEWEKTLDLPTAGWDVLELRNPVSAGGAEWKRLDDRSLLATGPSPSTDTYTFEATAPHGGIRAIRLEALTHPDLTRNGPGRAHNGNFVLAIFRVYAAPVSDPEQRREVTIKSAAADFEEPGLEVVKVLDGDPYTGWAIYRPRDMNQNRTATFVLAEPLDFGEAAELTFVLEHHYGREHNIGRLRLAVTNAMPETITLPDAVMEALQTPAEERTAQQQDRILSHYGQFDAKMRELQARLDGIEKIAPGPPETQAQTLVQHGEPRTTRIHLRGDFLAPGDEVDPHTPAVLHALRTTRETPNRLDLAQWIVDPENPLTARVQVNRMWMYLFGRGIVTTPGDFGTRSEPPSHPELLDWLAAEFMERGWSTKDMIRLIVHSATYRQDSKTRPELMDRDPYNRLLARQSRYRVEAEVTRDLYLAASGLLHPVIGGPSIRPQMPGDIAQLGYANSIRWEESPAPDKYRRGLYIFFQRTVPYPMLMTFDCPDSNVSAEMRNRSNTPLQALTLLNSPVFFETAQALGGRVLAENIDCDRARVERMFRLCMGRPPACEEIDALVAFLDGQRERFASDPDLSVRFADAHQPETAQAAEAAAHVALARVIMNVDEFLTRE